MEKLNKFFRKVEFVLGLEEWGGGVYEDVVIFNEIECGGRGVICSGEVGSRVVDVGKGKVIKGI